MNIPRNSSLLPGCKFSRAFTITEMMVVMAIFSLVILAIISVQIFGMRMYQISETKMSATASGRRALNVVRGDILSGKTFVVQNGNYASHANIADNYPQIGNALQIFPTASKSNYVLYYTDTTENSLLRYTSPGGQIEVVATYITNRLAFQSEDYRGNVLSNNQNNQVIRMNLEFYRWEFPLASAGNGAMYDSYHLQTRITRRTID